MSNIQIKRTKSLWQTISDWFRGNAQLIKQGEHKHFKALGNKSEAYEKGDVLTGFFIDPETKKYVFGNAVYLGDQEDPNYKILNYTNPEL